jgi:hypothetical protein
LHTKKRIFSTGSPLEHDETTSQDQAGPRIPEAQIKKHARPEKIQEKGPLRPFFLSPHAIHLSNIESDFPT